jgi:hypothetical protein
MIDPQDSTVWQWDKRFNISNVLAIVSLVAIVFLSYTDTAKTLAILQTRLTQTEKEVSITRQDLASSIVDLKFEIRELRKELITRREQPNGR